MKSCFVNIAAALALIGSASVTMAQNSVSHVQVSLKQAMAEGATIYQNQCARCHGRNGEGQRQGHDAAPRLAGNFAHLSVKEIAVQVIRGGSYMPPFHNMTDRDIAIVATYVRNSFGNSHGIATEEEVAETR